MQTHSITQFSAIIAAALVLLASTHARAEERREIVFDDFFQYADVIDLSDERHVQAMYETLAYNDILGFACAARINYIEECENAQTDFQRAQIAKRIRTDKDTRTAMNRWIEEAKNRSYCAKLHAPVLQYQDGAFHLQIPIEFPGTIESKLWRTAAYASYTPVQDGKILARSGVAFGLSKHVRWLRSGYSMWGQVAFTAMPTEVASLVDSHFGESIHLYTCWRGLPKIKTTTRSYGGRVMRFQTLVPNVVWFEFRQADSTLLWSLK